MFVPLSSCLASQPHIPTLPHYTSLPHSYTHPPTHPPTAIIFTSSALQIGLGRLQFMRLLYIFITKFPLHLILIDTTASLLYVFQSHVSIAYRQTDRHDKHQNVSVAITTRMYIYLPHPVSYTLTWPYSHTQTHTHTRTKTVSGASFSSPLSLSSLLSLPLPRVNSSQAQVTKLF